MPNFFSKKVPVAPTVTSSVGLPVSESSEKKSVGRKFMRFIKKSGGRKRTRPSTPTVVAAAVSETTPEDGVANAVQPPLLSLSGGSTTATEPIRGPVIEPGQTSTNNEPKKKWKKVKKTLRNIFAVFSLGVEGVAAAADAFPPAKSTAAGLVFIKDVVQKIRDDKEDSERVLRRTERLGGLLENATLNDVHFSKPMEEVIFNLNHVLVQGTDDVSRGTQLGLFGRLTRLRKRSGQRRHIRECIQHAIEEFTIRALSELTARPVQIQGARNQEGNEDRDSLDLSLSETP